MPQERGQKLASATTSVGPGGRIMPAVSRAGPRSPPRTAPMRQREPGCGTAAGPCRPAHQAALGVDGPPSGGGSDLQPRRTPARPRSLRDFAAPATGAQSARGPDRRRAQAQDRRPLPSACPLALALSRPMSEGRRQDAANRPLPPSPAPFSGDPRASGAQPEQKNSVRHHVMNATGCIRTSCDLFYAL